MSHTIPINEASKTLFVLVVDQSGSMNEPYGLHAIQTKAEAVADAVNATLSELVSRCRDGNRWRHYYDIAAVGYSGRGVYPLFASEQWVVSPAALVAQIVRTRSVSREGKNAAGMRVTMHSSHKVWVEPYAEGTTPMHGAFLRTLELLLAWREAQPSLAVYPPTIIHITDGELTDASAPELRLLGDRIAGATTTDGPPTLFNVHIATNDERSMLFPHRAADLSRPAQLLFDLSSPLPERLRVEVNRYREIPLPAAVRAMAYNASPDELVRMMDIGSSSLTHAIR